MSAKIASAFARAFLFIFFLASCSPAALSVPPTSTPAPLSEPTATPDAEKELPTPAPSTPLPSSTSRPSATPSPTPSFPENLYPPDIEIPPAEIELLSPAAGARVVSPITIRADIFPGPGGRIRVELLGEDGRSLSRNVLIWAESTTEKRSINTILYFEISGVAEAGRLIISVDDDYGRLKALNSASVILLSDGLREASFSTDMQERILVLNLQPNTVIPSGPIEISGIARPLTDLPLNVQLITRDGRVLAFGHVYPVQPEGYDYSIFSIQLDAEVSARQWVQLTIRETALRVPGDVYFSSFEFVLAP
jgi:hypothetical protein